MEDELSGLAIMPRPTRNRPLLGLTVLVVEDSRYASDALRLMCLRSGARIRRADCMASAKRHLNVYQPSVAIVDLGLPDGSGLDLIKAMHAAKSRVPILLGTSGESATEICAAAGADGFLAKPISSLATFQAAVLEHLPDALRPRGPRDADTLSVSPDPVALKEDLSHALDLLDVDRPPLPYVRQFLIGLARTAEDQTLERSALGMDAGGHDKAYTALRALLNDKIQELTSPI